MLRGCDARGRRRGNEVLTGLSVRGAAQGTPPAEGRGSGRVLPSAAMPPRKRGAVPPPLIEYASRSVDPVLPWTGPVGRSGQAVSKQNPPAHRLTVAYWRSRLFQNSYTRGGQLKTVRGWRIKVQVGGRRRTFSLKAPGRDAAARQALALYRSLHSPELTGGLQTSPSRVVKSPSSAERLRLVQRPHAPANPGEPEWSVWLERDGQGNYFPLATRLAAEAGQRARQLYRDLHRRGVGWIQSRHPREVTVSIRWCPDPIMWTYFSLHTLPGRTPRPAPAAPRIQGSPRFSVGVAVVEPETALRAALVEALTDQPGCRVVAAWPGAVEALDGLAGQSMDLLLVNQSLDGITGADFVARLHLLQPRLAARVYSVCSDSDELFRSTPGGVSAYLLRRTPLNRLLEPLEGMPPSGRLESPELTLRVQRYFQRLIGASVVPGTSAEMARLTPRELEILALMAKGFLDKEIAHRLRISVWTVHGHAKRIYEKLEVHSRTEAVVRYLQK